MQGKIAFLYPGQGAQKAGMGLDFYNQYKSAHDLYCEADKILDFDLKKICFSDDERIHETSFTQPVLVATSLAITRCLKERGIVPDITAGLSLGEYSAISAAKGFSELDAIALVRARGRFMEEAVPNGEGTMAAVLGLSKEQTDQVVNRLDGVWIANYNCPGQIVITGKMDSVDEAGKQLKEAGAKRVVQVKVSGPFHSPMMENAANKLEKKLMETPIEILQVPYISNMDAEINNKKENIIPLLTKQMTHPVLWEQSIRRMLAEGVNTFLEVGPGHTLTNFVKKVNSNVTVYSVGTANEMEYVIGEVLCRENK